MWGDCYQVYNLDLAATRAFEREMKPGLVRPRDFDPDWHLKHENSYKKFVKEEEESHAIEAMLEMHELEVEQEE